MPETVIRSRIDSEVKQEAQAIEHDRWFREQVKLAVAEADAPSTVFVPHEKVRGQWKAKRERTLKQSENKP